jgi:UDP-N-acetylglucosamine:LPS N-acetylglucosamine transferase
MGSLGFSIPSIVHQQDVLPGLANKLMSKTAKIITVTFPEAKKYYGSKADGLVI